MSRLSVMKAVAEETKAASVFKSWLQSNYPPASIQNTDERGYLGFSSELKVLQLQTPVGLWPGVFSYDRSSAEVTRDSCLSTLFIQVHSSCETDVEPRADSNTATVLLTRVCVCVFLCKQARICQSMKWDSLTSILAAYSLAMVRDSCIWRAIKCCQDRCVGEYYAIYLSVYRLNDILTRVFATCEKSQPL